MAPPKSYAESNPTIVPFDEVKIEYIDENGKNVVIRDYEIRPGSGYEILTDDVLNSGNLELLNNFKINNLDKLNDPNYLPAKKYLDARIRNAERIQAYENKAKLFASQKKAPYKPPVVEAEGFILIPNIEYPDYQTSSNGCWSISYSTLLKSRGINISQEEIRQWRPDYKENAGLDERANKERKVLMNTDTSNSIYENADLVGKVLPNTAVNMLRMEAFEPGTMTINGNPLNEQQKNIVQQEYLKQVKEKLRSTLLSSFTDHQSPVAISMGGHYVTVTGISLDGNRIMYEESLGREYNAPRSRVMSLDALVNQAMLSHTVIDENGIEKEEHAQGIELTWLSDLPVKEYGQIEDGLDPGQGDEHYVKADENGNVTVNVPDYVANKNVVGRPVEGQVTSKAIEERFELDQTNLTQQLNGVKVEGWGADKGVMFGQTGSYYPGKVMRPGDKNLMLESISSMDELIDGIRVDLNYINNNRATQEEYAKVSEFKNALTDIQDAANGKEVDVEQARLKVAGMYDFLSQKPDETGKTRFEKLYHGMDYGQRKEFLDKLRMLNISLGFDRENKVDQFEELHEKMEADYQKEKAYNDAQMKYRNNLNALWKNVQDNGAFNNFAGSQQQDDMHFSLALIAANMMAYQKNLQNHKMPPYPTDEEVYSYVDRVRNSEEFRETVKDPKQWMTDKTKTYKDFVEDYNQTADRLNAEREDLKRYETPGGEPWRLRRTRLGLVVNVLNATGTGSYTGMDVISRKKNSDSFDQALEAIEGIALKPVDAPPSAKEIKTSVTTVLSYLDGKEKKRSTPFGRHRWTNCMIFLAETMPREDFEAYCAHVNEVRGVGPGHEDFVSPETFYPSTTAKYVMNDSVNRIVRGKHTLRDYARVIAMHKLGTQQNGEFQEGMRLTTNEARQQLAAETQRVMNDPRFEAFVNGAGRKQLLPMMKGDARSYAGAWETYKAANPVAEQHAAKQTESQTQPVQPAKTVQPMH